MTIVAKAEGYSGGPIKGYQGVMQREPLPPTIFNMVVDAVICHWATLATPTEAGMGGLGLKTIDLSAYFYANNGLVASTQPESIQRAFNALTSLFNRVSLRKNTEKTVGMVCQPCHAPGGMSEEAYERWMTGKRLTFWERQRRRVSCPE